MNVEEFFIYYIALVIDAFAWRSMVLSVNCRKLRGIPI